MNCITEHQNTSVVVLLLLGTLISEEQSLYNEKVRNFFPFFSSPTFPQNGKAYPLLV